MKIFTNSRHKQVIVLACVLVFFNINRVLGEDLTLILNNTNQPPYTTAAQDGFADEIANEAFRRIGYKLKLVIQPPERGLKNADSGLIDGDLTRIEGLESRYPNLVRVPETLLDWHFVAFSKAGSESDLSTIRHSSVGLIKGWKIYEDMLCCIKNPSIVLVDDVNQLFNLLKLNRVKYILYEKYQGVVKLKENDIQDAHAVQPALAVKNMHIYLHNKHAGLIPRLSEALRQLKQEGYYEQIRQAKLSIN